MCNTQWAVAGPITVDKMHPRKIIEMASLTGDHKTRGQHWRLMEAVDVHIARAIRLIVVRFQLKISRIK